MTDAYTFDQEDPLEPPQQGVAFSNDGRSATHGRVARMRDGSYAVWQEPVSGRGGRFVALNTSTADQRSRERFEEVQNRLRVGRDTQRIAREFVDINREQRSGGPLDRLQLWGGFQASDFGLPGSDNETLPRLQRMRNLSRQIVGANWIPGTSGMQNTATEQELIAQRYPTPGNRGQVNLDIYLDIAEGVAEQQAAVRDMEQWLSRRTTLDGWDEHWQQIGPQIRRQARAQALRDLRDGSAQDGASPQGAQPGVGTGIGAMVGARGAARDVRERPSQIPANEWAAMTPEERNRVIQILGRQGAQ